MDLYRNIRARREFLGMSQEELADKVGYTSRTSVAKIESGAADIPQAKIEAFAQALQLSPVKLMGWDSSEYLREDSSKHRIPVFKKVFAGDYAFATSNIKYFEESEDGSIDYAFIQRGDSMIGGRIYDGDLVFISLKDVKYLPGDIVVDCTNGRGGVLKRYYSEDGEIVLKPENPAMKTTRHKPEQVVLFGKVKRVTFEL